MNATAMPGTSCPPISSLVKTSTSARSARLTAPMPMDATISSVVTPALAGPGKSVHGGLDANHKESP